MRLRKATSLLLVIAACAAAGCGSDEEPKPSLPTAASAELMKRLTSIQGRFDFGGDACKDIPKDQQLVNDDISKLPSSVDDDVRNALQDSFDHLFDLTDSQCDENKGENTDTETTPTTDTTETTETTPTTDTTETQPTETTPTDTTPTDTVPTDTTPVPPDGANGGGAQTP